MCGISIHSTNLVCENDADDECKIIFFKMNDKMQNFSLDDDVNRFRHAQQKIRRRIGRSLQNYKCFTLWLCISNTLGFLTH